VDCRPGAPVDLLTEIREIARGQRARQERCLVPELRTATGLGQVRIAFNRLFIDAAPGTLTDLEAIFAHFPADVTLANSLVFADRWLHERGGPPNTSLGTTMLGLYSRDCAPFGLGLMPSSSAAGRLRNRLLKVAHRRIVFGPVNRHLDDVRQRLGLPRQGQAVIDTFLSPFPYLQDTVPSFAYPRTDLAPQVHFVGPLLPAPPPDFQPPAWWPELSATPRFGYARLAPLP
jgi:hypothetical protein